MCGGGYVNVYEDGIFGKGNRTASTDTTSFVQVGELWDDTNQRFNEDELNVLMKYVMGDNNTTISKIESYVNSGGTVAGKRARTAEDMRNDAVSAGVQGDLAYDAKSSGSDIRVTLGGLKWEVVFLSRDTQRNPILTLWLDDCVQDAWTGRSSTEGAYYGFVNGGLYSDWSANWSDSSDPGGKAYPSNMYGTSYINAVTLNNGGKYATSTSASVTAAKRSSSVFAKFTMSRVSKLTEYIVTPNYVAWQKNQSAVDQIGYSFNLSNDAWNTSLRSTNFYSTSYNYAYLNASAGTTRSGDNDAWRNSNLWLPSFTEVGGGNYTTSLWKPSVNQRNNNNGVYVSYSSVGSSNTNSYYCDLYLRSGAGNNANVAHTMTYNGKTANGTTVHNSCGVRPALHLNLNTAYLSASEDYVEVGEIYDEDTKSFDSDNVDILLKYILGDGQATFDSSASYRSTTLTKLSTYATNTFTPTGGTSTQTGFNAGAMREKRVKNGGTSGSTYYVAKTSGQDIVVTLGGLKWEAVYLSKDDDGNTILTLWLDSAKQEKWETGTYSTVPYSSLSSGVYTSMWSAGWSDSAVTIGGYYSNLYSTSYISTEVLNNAGGYPTSGNNLPSFASSSTSNPFAMFTMSQYGLLDYLVLPNYVSWQIEQYAIDILGNTYNLPNESIYSDDSGFYSSEFNYSNYAHDYIDMHPWGDCYLWLPSLSEVGITTANNGLWGTSKSQRFDINSGKNTWLRSGAESSASTAYTLYAKKESTYKANVGSYFAGVRPALHLNLTAIEEKFDSDKIPITGDLYNRTDGTVNKTNLNILYRYLTGRSRGTLATVNSQITSGGGAIDSKVLREKSLVAGSYGSTSYNKKKSGDDITVTLAGLTWKAVYLSTDANGNTILTLWMDGYQEEWKDKAIGSTYHTVSNGVMYSKWSAGWSSSSISGTYVSNIYGTSYMNAVTLDNTGTLAQSITAGKNSTVRYASSNNLYYFTNNTNLRNNYLVTPSVMGWQGTQSAISLQDTEWNQPNEGYNVTDGFYFNGSLDMNFSSKTNNDAWKNSYLWLPSLSEVGYGDGSNQKGLFNTSTTLRANTITSKAPVAGLDNAYSFTWTRSGCMYNADTVYAISPDGSSARVSYNVGAFAFVVRPCVHLNLTAMNA